MLRCKNEVGVESMKEQAEMEDDIDEEWMEDFKLYD